MEITSTLVNKLERLALVNFGSEKGIKVLKDAVTLANQMKEIDVMDSDVCFSIHQMHKPTPNLTMGDDFPSQNENRKAIMGCAKKIEDIYFVSPPGKCIILSSLKPTSILT